MSCSDGPVPNARSPPSMPCSAFATAEQAQRYGVPKLDAIGTAGYPPLGIAASRSVGVSLSNTMQSVDPVIGLRVRHEFSPTQNIMVRGDVGGFGLGSQFSWQALGV